MPLLKPKDDKPKKGVEMTYDMILCCMCKSKDYKPTFKMNATGSSKQFYCANCGHQLTFKQLDVFVLTDEFKKQKKEMGIK